MKRYPYTPDIRKRECERRKPLIGCPGICGAVDHGHQAGVDLRCREA
jgi:hypothetical protein